MHAPAREHHYRPHLDGLRCVAVYLVVAFHAGFSRFRGGFIGVDVFFVLSGYLVTRILLHDLASRGRVRARIFYSRRARRILPAALVTLLVTAIVYQLVVTPAQALDAIGGFRAACVYLANWFFIRESADYFATDVSVNPVLHFWSLAVEEQFYLLWPLILGGLFVATRRARRWQWWVLRVIVVALGAASAIAALRIGATRLDRAYYGTDTRAYQLLAGAAIALSPQVMQLGPRLRRVARGAVPIALAVLVVLATSAVDVSAITRGVWVTVCAAVLIVALENVNGGRVKQLLSAGPITYLGRISYGTYLWHWPLGVVVAYRRDLSPLELFAIVGPGATLLAAVSFRLLEQPIRTSAALDRHKMPVIAFGLAASIVAGLVLTPALLERGASETDWRVARLDHVRAPTCLGRPLDRCVLTRGTGPKVLLMGDSHAQMWMPAFIEIAKREGWTLMIASNVSCTWQTGLQHLRRSQYVKVCRHQQRDWYSRVVPTFEPDIVVLAQQAPDDPAFPMDFVDGNGQALLPGDRQLERALESATAQSLAALRRPGRQVVVIEPIPLSTAQQLPIPCLSEGGPESRCAYQASRTPTQLEEYLRRRATADPALVSLDADRLVCPRWPTCDPVVGDIIVKNDRTHMTATFARSLAGPLRDRLRAAGVG